MWETCVPAPGLAAGDQFEEIDIVIVIVVIVVERLDRAIQRYASISRSSVCVHKICVEDQGFQHHPRYVSFIHISASTSLPRNSSWILPEDENERGCVVREGGCVGV